MYRLLLTCMLATLTGFSHAAGFTFYSPELKPQHLMPRRFEYKGFGCSGDNKSPELKWSGAPKGTKSFALTVYDPDAPTGSGWWHWAVFNIPAGVHSLPADAGSPDGAKLPPGASQARNDFGTAAWGGPCPPKGDKPHRYVFTLYALGTDKLTIPADASAAQLKSRIQAHMLDKTGFVTRYGR